MTLARRPSFTLAVVEEFRRARAGLRLRAHASVVGLFPSLTAPAVAAALLATVLLAVVSLSVKLLGVPSPPSPGRASAAIAAVTLARMGREEVSGTTFEKAKPLAWSTPTAWPLKLF